MFRMKFETKTVSFSIPTEEKKKNKPKTESSSGLAPIPKEKIECPRLESPIDSICMIKSQKKLGDVSNELRNEFGISICFFVKEHEQKLERSQFRKLKDKSSVFDFF